MLEIMMNEKSNIQNPYYSAQSKISLVYLNLSYCDKQPNTIIIPSSPFLFLKAVERHPPAFVVIPVLSPNILF